MKIILSRKGFDSGYGRVPSPIFPNAGMISLPIPSQVGIAAGACAFQDQNLGDIFSDLTKGRLGAGTSVHLDPDLEQTTLPRAPGWQPAFGQASAAQTHLRNQGVGVGDLFLFFGWFQPVYRYAGKWTYVPGSRSFHAIFGWLQVQDVLDIEAIATSELPEWISGHPHAAFANRFAGQPNTIYVGRKVLGLDGRRSIRGSGAFPRWTPWLTLTASECSRSVWSVPRWMAPKPGGTPLTYHGNPERWVRKGEELLLRSVAKGQEFVLDTNDYPEARHWARGLIEEHT